ncbi:MAG: type II toxin-antitoxin system PemK/MazF family toxin [Chloroflexi bacterium]|nr:type II toxin-antitoxin system PemK/MazF family toxin [Chloroflexota bacterium]
MRRGELWWASLSDPLGSAPGFLRPVVVIQCDSFNESRINTVVVAAVTSNLRLAKAPGNVPMDSGESDLPRDSVVNVSQILTIDKSFLVQRVSLLADEIMARVDAGVRLVLGL